MPTLQVIASSMEIAARQNEGVAHLVFADPPYNQGIDYGGSCDDNLPAWRYRECLSRWVHLAYSMARPGGVVAFLVPEQWADDYGQMLSLKGDRVARVIWHERFAQYNRHGLTREHRHLFIHQKAGGPLTFNPDPIRVPSERMKSGDPRAAGPRIPGDVWTVSRLQGNARTRVDWAPCQLPTPPLERLVLGWTNPGDTVLDCFACSGSMGLAALHLSRNFIAIEKNGVFAARCFDRLSQIDGVTLRKEAESADAVLN